MDWLTTTANDDDDGDGDDDDDDGDDDDDDDRHQLHAPKARAWNLTVVFDYTEFDKPCIQQVRADVWEVFEQPSSSALARVWMVFIICVIVLSTVLTVMLTMPEYYDDGVNVNGAAGSSLFWLEFAVGVVFTVEFLGRALTTPNWKAFATRSIMNWIDLLSIVPFWGDIAVLAVNAGRVQGDHISADDIEFLVVLRVLRVFRILKVRSCR